MKRPPALHHRNYRLYFAGQGLSVLGTWMQRMAMPWLVYRLSGSELLLGVTGFISNFPVLLLAPLVLLHAAEPGNASNKSAAITVAAGGLPIILTAPHGGSVASPGVPARKGDGVTRFNPRADTNTDILTEKLADALEQKLGKRPYVVIARFHRKCIDANRRPADAFEVPEAKATYDAYHAEIASRP